MIWKPGEQVENGGSVYQIEAELGHGGFGKAYKAKPLHLGGGYVVIKVPNNGDDRRFLQEAGVLQHLSSFSHPNIVRVRDRFRTKDDIECLVMDYIPGENLFKVIERKGALSEKEAISCFRQIADALKLIHSVNWVHRDIHPGNVILQSNGRAVLIDFGIAKNTAINERKSKNLSQHFHPGNSTYAPYEQFLGNQEATVDIYALSSTLYYAVTGQSPQDSQNRKFYKERFIATKNIKKISKQLDRVISSGMELEAEDRPKSVTKWLRLLDEADKKPTDRIFEKFLKLLEKALLNKTKARPGNFSNSQGNLARNYDYEVCNGFEGQEFSWQIIALPYIGYAFMGSIFANVSITNLTRGLLLTIAAIVLSFCWALAGTLVNLHFDDIWMRRHRARIMRFSIQFVIVAKNLLISINWSGIVFFVAHSIFLLTGQTIWTALIAAVVITITAGFDMRTWANGYRHPYGLQIAGELLNYTSRPNTFLILLGVPALSLFSGFLLSLLFMHIP